MKIHYDEHDIDITSCGLSKVTYTDEIEKVTCKNCLKIELRFQKKLLQYMLEDIPIVQMRIVKIKRKLNGVDE